LGSIKEYEPLEWVRTGIPAIDLVIGAGMPRGRMIEVVGEPSTTKSALGYAIIASFQRAGGKCVLIDSEAKSDRSFIERFGVNFEDLSYSKGGSMKDVIQLIGRVAQMADPAIPVLIVWDSIAATPGAEELELHVSDKEFKGEMAARARYLSAAFRAVCNDLARKKVTLLAINQLRTKFNFMGHTSMESPGGKAPKYHAAVRIHMKDTGKIQHPDTDVVVGIRVLFKAIKNSCSVPFRYATLTFKFDTGFSIYSGLDELLIRHRRVESKAGWLTYQGKTFRAGDIERLVAEMPDIVNPLNGVIEIPDKSSNDSSSRDESKSEADSESETAKAAAGEDE
jgi:recombination protein RecA